MKFFEMGCNTIAIDTLFVVLIFAIYAFAIQKKNYLIWTFVNIFEGWRWHEVFEIGCNTIAIDPFLLFSFFAILCFCHPKE